MLMDLEPGTMDSVRAGPFGQLFHARESKAETNPGVSLEKLDLNAREKEKLDLNARE